MGRIIFLLISLAFSSFAGVNAHKSYENKNVAKLLSSEIRDLSSAIKAAPSYREDLRLEINPLEDSLLYAESDSVRFEAAIKLSSKFRPINTDSAFYYAHCALSIAEGLGESYRLRTHIALIDALATAGLFTEATEQLSNLPVDKLSPENKIFYWLAARRLYGYMKSYAQGNQRCFNKYDNLYRQYDDSLLLHLPPNSDLHVFLESERLVTERKFLEARQKLENLLSRLPQESNLYGMSAFQLARLWQQLGDETKYVSYLALSALSDVKGCVTDGLALPTLADWLYLNGEIHDAFSFINFALEEASTGNVRMRAVTIAQFVPLIDDAYNERISSSRDELMIYFMLLAILLVATAVLIVFLVRQYKKTRATAEKLAVTSKRQESYIGNFIGLYSSYADRLNHFVKLVSTKLSAGQTTELKKLLDSGKFTDLDNDNIHKIFDTAFLDIYPDFISNVNSLLRPEEAVQIKTGNMLTPELRIYAFVKLGIDESTRIAQILHYSINTVYTYRNKMRNKAIQRDTFDEDVKKL